MRSGSINIKQAAEALGMEPAMLAYQLAGKVRSYHVCYQVTMLLIVTKLLCYSLLPSYRVTHCYCPEWETLGGQFNFH